MWARPDLNWRPTGLSRARPYEPVALTELLARALSYGPTFAAPRLLPLSGSAKRK